MSDQFSSNLNTEIQEDFRLSNQVDIKEGILGSKLTTVRIGGKLQYLVEPNLEAELSKIISWAAKNSQKINLIGAGSNLLIDSAGILGWSLRLGRGFKSLVKLEGSRFKVGAAYSLMALSRELSSAGFSGLEFAAGIPGSIGGATRMNAGAHKGELASVIKAVEGFNSVGIFQRYEANQITFSYRECSLPKDFLISAIEIELIEGDALSIMQKLTANLEYRKKTQPLALPSFGSVFRNPKQISAGELLEKLGLKGRKIGNAQISELHANWIVNPFKTASSSDVKELMLLCQTEAKRQYDIELQAEVVMW